MDYVLYLLGLVVGVLVFYGILRLAIQHAIQSVMDSQARAVQQIRRDAEAAELVRQTRGEQPW